MSSTSTSSRNNREASVAERYSAAAQSRETALCCPVQYRREYLDIIPKEILDRDYGCGDPIPYVREGETVLDLGSDGGKICCVLSQVVGPEGRVIGVDCNREMIALARRHRDEVAGRVGVANVEFRYGLIQDLALDLEELAEETRGLKIETPQDWIDLRQTEQRLRHESPMVPDDSVDCVVSNCVLNLVRPEDRRRLFSEIFRVLKLGGRVAISDIVADEDVPENLQKDPALWSGCISGAFREDRFLKVFEEAGFYGIEIAARQSEPWRTVEGIEFRSPTVVARKDKQGPCLAGRLGVTEHTCLCVGQQTVEVVPAVSHAALFERAEQLSITLGDPVVCRSRYQGHILGIEASDALDRLHYLSAGSVSFARGLNDTPKIAALLLVAPLFGSVGSTLLVALPMALAGLLSARRVAEVMSRRITPMNHGQGLVANLVTSAIVIGASRFWMPVSTTHVSCGALFGIGTVTRQARLRVIATILSAWVTTLPAGGPLRGRRRG